MPTLVFQDYDDFERPPCGLDESPGDRVIRRVTLATSAVSGPQSAVSPLQHSAWFAPYIGHPLRTHAA